MKHYIDGIFLLFGVLLPASLILPENSTGLVMGVFMVITIILVATKHVSLSIARYTYLFGLLFILYLISLLYSDNLDEGKIKVSIKLPLLILPILMSIFLSERTPKIRFKFLQNIVYLFALSTGYFLILAVYRSVVNGSIYYTHPESGEVLSTFFTYVGLSEWVIHPAYLSLWAGTAFLLSVFYVYKNPEKILNWVVLFSLFILILLSQSRMNILSLIVVLACISVVVVFRKYSLKKSIIIIATMSILTGITVSALPDRFKGRFKDFTTLEYNIEAESFHDGFNGITIRLAEWKCALQEIEKRPFFGSGVGDARFHLEESYKRNKFVYGYREKFNAHNQFIETTLAIGLVGLMVLLAIFFYAFYTAYKYKLWHVAAVTAYIFLCFLSESYLERQWGVVFIGFMMPALLECEIALQHDEKKILDEN